MHGKIYGKTEHLKLMIRLIAMVHFREGIRKARHDSNNLYSKKIGEIIQHLLTGSHEAQLLSHNVPNTKFTTTYPHSIQSSVWTMCIMLGICVTNTRALFMN